MLCCMPGAPGPSLQPCARRPPTLPCPALRSWDALAERSLALIRANLGTLQAFFARWAHVFSYAPPPAGTVCFPRLLTGEPVEAWCEELVQASGVLLMPATVYGAPAFTAEGRFRLGFGRANLPQCLARLDAWLVGRYGEPPSPAAGASE